MKETRRYRCALFAGAVLLVAGCATQPGRAPAMLVLVVNEQGLPVQGALVTWDRGQMWTDSHGIALIERVPDDHRSLAATAQGYLADPLLAEPEVNGALVRLKLRSIESAVRLAIASLQDGQPGRAEELALLVTGADASVEVAHVVLVIALAQQDRAVEAMEAARVAASVLPRSQALRELNAVQGGVSDAQTE